MKVLSAERLGRCYMWFNPADFLEKEVLIANSANLLITKTATNPEISSISSELQDEIIWQAESESLKTSIKINAINATCRQCSNINIFNSDSECVVSCSASDQLSSANFEIDTEHQCIKFASRNWWVVTKSSSYEITTLPSSTYAEILKIEPNALSIKPYRPKRLYRNKRKRCPLLSKLMSVKTYV